MKQCFFVFVLASIAAWPALGASVDVYPGTDIQGVVNAHAAGTTYVLKSGIHRMQTINPKNGDTFTGEPGTILNGSKLLTSFSRSGNYWVASGQTQQGPAGGSDCEDGYPRCNNPEDFFINDVPLQAVDSLSKVGPGKYYFDYSGHNIYFSDAPTGQGQIVETSITQAAFRGFAVNVTITGLTIEKYAGPTDTGPVNFDMDGDGWLVQNNEVRYNHAGGIRTGSRIKIVNNKVWHNGQVGILGGGDNVLVDSNEVAYNNSNHYAWGMEAGGLKFANTNNLVISNNNSHDNDGAGIWTDMDSYNCLYDSNQVSDNAAPGIFHETSQDCVIRNNTVTRNGLGEPDGMWFGGIGILVSNSQNVEVYGNTVTDNNGGIGLMWRDRGISARTGQPYDSRNNNIHDNTVTLTSALQGGQTLTSNSSFFGSWNNRFHGNVYYLDNMSGAYFAWSDAYLNKSGWQAKGQDTDGVFLARGSAPPPAAPAAPLAAPSSSQLAVSIASPSNGATVFGSITVTTNVSGAVTGVAFLVDGNYIGTEVVNSPFSRGINTTLLSNGPHTFQVIAQNAASTETSDSITVNVSNGNSNLPTVSITSPADGATVSGDVTMTTSANSAVTGIAVLVDGNYIGTEVVNTPFSRGINTALLSNGLHTFQVIAENAASIEASASITVNVSNGRRTR